jgi:hypothetical protein
MAAMSNLIAAWLGRLCLSAKTLMVRGALLRVSNHEAPISASSFETPLTRLLWMRGEDNS